MYLFNKTDKRKEKILINKNQNTTLETSCCSSERHYCESSHATIRHQTRKKKSIKKNLSKARNWVIRVCTNNVRASLSNNKKKSESQTETTTASIVYFESNDAQSLLVSVRGETIQNGFIAASSTLMPSISFENNEDVFENFSIISTGAGSASAFGDISFSDVSKPAVTAAEYLEQMKVLKKNSAVGRLEPEVLKENAMGEDNSDRPVLRESAVDFDGQGATLDGEHPTKENDGWPGAPQRLKQFVKTPPSEFYESGKKSLEENFDVVGMYQLLSEMTVEMVESGKRGVKQIVSEDILAKSSCGSMSVKTAGPTVEDNDGNHMAPISVVEIPAKRRIHPASAIHSIPTGLSCTGITAATSRDYAMQQTMSVERASNDEQDIASSGWNHNSVMSYEEGPLDNYFSSSKGRTNVFIEHILPSEIPSFREEQLVYSSSSGTDLHNSSAANSHIAEQSYNHGENTNVRNHEIFKGQGHSNAPAVDKLLGVLDKKRTFSEDGSMPFSVEKATYDPTVDTYDGTLPSDYTYESRVTNFMSSIVKQGLCSVVKEEANILASDLREEVTIMAGDLSESGRRVLEAVLD